MDRQLDEAIGGYYARGREAARLSRGHSRVERARTQEVISRTLAPPPGVVLDVGGGSGVYACWLANLGYAVHLVDPVALHVEQARAAAAVAGQTPLASATVGDARNLEHGDGTADAVLLLGPLYHLTERGDRLAALGEARRVLRPGGLVFAAGISRFASLLDGLRLGSLDDPAFQEIVERDLQSGQHRNPTSQPGYFTTAYFHHPDELREEVAAAGFQPLEVVSLEGPAGVLSAADLDRWWEDDQRRARLLAALRRVEHEPSLLGLSSHLLVIGRA